MLHLDKPFVFIDLETTGINVATDRIIEISMLKILPGGNQEVKTYRINPGIPIPADSTAIHGITDADLKDAPRFEKVATEIRDFIGNADLGGYNSNKFDIPLLIEEFLRADIGFDDERRYVDVMRIFTLMEKRTLEAAYKFFCNKELENAHSAEADVKATYEVLLGQIDRYKDDLKNDISFLHEFSKDGDFVDTGRRMIYKDGKEYFNFGKYNGRLVEEIFQKEPQYFDWIINNDFPLHTKLKLKMMKLRFKQSKTRN
ncbi:MAG: 3'-5' exonuclease [Bacteroidetes bacterium]|nr:3'-5' exonuclease [Bacteroidota bacterium]MBP7398767.1 3'-5' exonuclease [Chitinophagales bacterium]MBK7109692.1 3'-5' exonuclease [Bacteroidota bacterium]MBK8487571.1 3'-5' exonuclease [Bacteroidota bacterium]MBK8682683.1 3'-5' exonuclease [Bacteroidota bacterium]